MWPYFVTTIFALIFAYLCDREQAGLKTYVLNGGIIKKEVRPQSIFLLFTFIVLFLLPAVRYGIGTDYFATYVPMFNRISSGTSSFNEAAFTYFVLKLSSFTSDYQWFFVITSFLTVGLTVLAMRKESQSLALSVFFYIMGGYYFYGFSGVRQALATAIFMYSIRYIRERKLIKFLICIFIATGVHTMAAVYIPMYWLCNIGINLKKRVTLLIGLAVARTVVGTLIRQVIMATSYSWYIGSKFDINEDALLLLLVNIGTLALGLIFCNKDESFYGKFFINMHTIATILSMYTSYLVVGVRIVYLFYFVNILSVPYFLSKVKERSENSNSSTIIHAVVYGVYIFYTIYTIYIIDSLNIIPYESIFS